MNISVRFFASIREQLGIDATTVDAAGLQNVRDLWNAVSDQPLDETTLIAVNKSYANPNHQVTDGDEVAFFPPITGG